MTADRDLLGRARAGDRAALEALLERHQDRIYRFGARMCRDPEDAKDVLQDTLLSAARGLGGFRGESSISTWLYAIARSYCIKKRRGDRLARTSDVLGDVADPARGPDEALAAKQVDRALDEAIAALDPRHREVLVLRDVEGLAAAEVSRVLGVSVAAVKSRLHRARLAVRAAVAPVLGVPEGRASSGCPDVLTAFSRRLEGEIGADDCAAIERHLEGCERCRRDCDSLKRTLAACASSGARAGVPQPVQAAVKRALRDLLATGA